MFGFLKRKTREINSPADGQIVSLEKVNDEVFSQGMAGDGVALIPMSDLFCAPIDGVVSKIFKTNPNDSKYTKLPPEKTGDNF